MKNKIVLDLKEIANYRFSIIQFNNDLYINEKDLINIEKLRMKGFNDLADSLNKLKIYHLDGEITDNKISEGYVLNSDKKASNNCECKNDDINFFLFLIVFALMILIFFFFLPMCFSISFGN